MSEPAGTPATTMHGAIRARDSQELAKGSDSLRAAGMLQLEQARVLIDALAPLPGERALGVGCGASPLDAEVARRVAPDGEVIRVDPLLLGADAAAVEQPAFYGWAACAGGLAQLRDRSFDLAYVHAVQHRVEGEIRALSDLRRVLRAGARVGLSATAMGRPQWSGVLARRSDFAGLGAAHAAGAPGPTLREEGDGLGTLLHEAGFVDVAVREHTIVDTVSGVDDWLAASYGGSGGSTPAGMSARELRWLRARLSLELELFRTPRGIRLQRRLVFATARRPA